MLVLFNLDGVLDYKKTQSLVPLVKGTGLLPSNKPYSSQQATPKPMKRPETIWKRAKMASELMGL